MAYSNWGAIVYDGHTRRYDREDVAAFDDDGLFANGQPIASYYRIYANIQTNRQRYGWGKVPAHMHCYHAVLGDGAIRLACHKTNPVVFDRSGDGQVMGLYLADLSVAAEQALDTDEALWEGTYQGYQYRAQRVENMIDLEWTEPGGPCWRARCGYLYGAGHTDVVDGPTKATYLQEWLKPPS